MTDIFSTNAREVGIFVDDDYQNTNYVQELIKSLPESTLIVLPFVTNADIKTRNEVLLKTQNPVRYWQTDDYEKERLAGDKQELLSDHMFISYLKFFDRSRLYVFPHVYGNPDSASYSSRAQALIIKAHLLGIKYNVIKEGSLDDLHNT